MIQIKDKSNCCGCTACASTCAYNAITMTPDSLGFLYPQVNAGLCVNCGLCDKICQFHDNYERYGNYDTPHACQFRLKQDEQLKKSQSGGAFFAIADKFIAEGGVVYGAAFTKTWIVTHQKAADDQSLSALRMSKYVQSDMRGVFTQVKEDLKNGIKVLFSGTACQVAGLKSYIPNRLHENLFCIDVICHGVPSPKIWDDYIAYLQQSRKSKIIKACFRDKRFGWHGARESFLFENGKEEFRRTSNYLYFSGLSIRESCSKCYYTNLKRVGDITLGDQWGIPKDSIYEDDKGLSLILINSEKGKLLFEGAELMAEIISLQECMQPQLQYPSTLHPAHYIFIADYENRGFLYVAKKYGDKGWRYKLKRIIKIIKDLIRPLIRR